MDTNKIYGYIILLYTVFFFINICIFFLNLIIIYFKNKTTKLDGFINVPLQKKKRKVWSLGLSSVCWSRQTTNYNGKKY